VRAVVQRVCAAQAVVEGEIVGEVGTGLCVLLGVAADDDEAVAERLAGKIARLRIFENDEGRFDRSLVDVHGGALVVSQFTLIADTAKGNRPSFAAAGRPSRPSACTRASASRSPATESTSPEVGSARGWWSSWQTTGP
jgi:D-tyrosyl-tRNA(Tyr) deacylase